MEKWFEAWLTFMNNLDIFRVQDFPAKFVNLTIKFILT